MIEHKFKFAGYDDWDRSLWEHKATGVILVSVDGMLCTRTPDWHEPIGSIGVPTPFATKGID